MFTGFIYTKKMAREGSRSTSSSLVQLRAAFLDDAQSAVHQMPGADIVIMKMMCFRC
jgi:hypothetical protein